MALIQSMILGAFFEPQDILAEDPPEAEEDTDVTVLAGDSLLTPGFAEGRTMKGHPRSLSASLRRAIWEG
jgi:hypothetical protein